MDFLEKDLEQIIWENNNELISEKGLPIRGIKKRQLRIGSYGVADIVTFYRFYDCMYITVYELKKEQLDANSLMQAFRYCAGIQHYINSHRDKNFHLIFSVKLVGKSIAGGDFGYMTPFLPSLEVFTYSLGIDGLLFKRHDRYIRREPNFKP